jgi:hypothetical protein
MRQGLPQVGRAPRRAGCRRAWLDRVSSVSRESYSEATVAEAGGVAPGRARLEDRRILVVGAGQDDHGIEDPSLGNGQNLIVDGGLTVAPRATR